MTRAEQRQTCTDHCAGCGRHFHGLGVFDLHRDGMCIDPAMVTVAKGKHKGRMALQVWTDNGWCDKVTGSWKDGRYIGHAGPVTIWQKYSTEEQRDALSILRGLTLQESDVVTDNEP